MMAQDKTGQSDAGWKQPRLPRWVRIAVIGRNPKATLVRIAVLIVTCSIVFKFILLHIQVEGISMLPTYPDRSIHFVNRFAYLWHEPQRGDVVGIRFSRAETNTPAGIHQTANWLEPPHVMLLKRIIGLPGETVAFVDGRVVINSEALDEPYEKLPCNWNLPPRKLGPDEYFVVGDNRSMPWEDHMKGGAQRSQIIGKAIL
ncbi:MAG: signal peptidase I [Verrucomicrobiota bacterium]|jgi:signal peptidase I